MNKDSYSPNQATKNSATKKKKKKSTGCFGFGSKTGAKTSGGGGHTYTNSSGADSNWMSHGGSDLHGHTAYGVHTERVCGDWGSYDGGTCDNGGGNGSGGCDSGGGGGCDSGGGGGCDSGGGGGCDSGGGGCD